MKTESKYQKICKTAHCIPLGRVASYSQVADLAGLPGRARLVGKALRSAAADMSVPWHRVLRSDGKIAFPAGSQQAKAQSALLQEEGVAVLKNRVKMAEYQWQPELAELVFKLDY